MIIPGSVTSIGEKAFNNCKLKSIILEDGISEISDYAFSGSGAERVVIPKSINEVNKGAFDGCEDLALVFYLGSEDEWNEVFIDASNVYLKDAEKVFNAKKRAYKFETNCENQISDITDYAIFEQPNVENGDKRLAGWYDNAALSGTPVSFPYYGTALTLYAEWSERTGSGFDDAIVIKADRKCTVSPTESGQYVYYEFVPNYTGDYSFYSTGNVDTYARLYDSKQNRLTSNDDGDDGNNFKITYKMTAGEKYYIAAKCYSGTADFELVAKTEAVAGTKTTCQTMQGGAKLFVVTPTYLPTGCTVMLALYDGDELVDMQTAENQNGTLYFMSTVPYTVAKVMAWDSLDNMTPVCESENVQ